MEKAKILLVGLGGMGNCHFLNWKAVEGAEVVACVGRGDADARRAAVFGLPLYGTIAEACRAQAVDLIDVCVPTWLHKPLVLEALRERKPVIVEKPMALSSRDAEEMFAAADGAGVPLYVAQVLQFTREVEALRSVVGDGRYGRPMDGHFERLSACPKWSQGGWLFDREKSGLLPFDLHIHDLDVIVSLCGAPDTVQTTACTAEGKDYKEHYRFLYGWKNGLHVSAEAAWLSARIPFTARWRVIFERGCLIAENGGVLGYDDRGNVTEFDVTVPVTVSVGTNLPPNGWFYRELSHFLDCARRGIPSPLVPREQVLAVLRIVEGI